MELSYLMKYVLFLLTILFTPSYAISAEPRAEDSAPPIQGSATAQEMENLEKSAMDVSESVAQEISKEDTAQLSAEAVDLSSDKVSDGLNALNDAVNETIATEEPETLISTEQSDTQTEVMAEDTDSAIMDIGQGEDIGMEVHMSEEITYDSVQITPVKGPGLAEEMGINTEELLDQAEPEELESEISSEAKIESAAEESVTEEEFLENNSENVETEDEAEIIDGTDEQTQETEEELPTYKRWWGRPY